MHTAENYIIMLLHKTTDHITKNYRLCYVLNCGQIDMHMHYTLTK